MSITKLVASNMKPVFPVSKFIPWVLLAGATGLLGNAARPERYQRSNSVT